MKGKKLSLTISTEDDNISNCVDPADEERYIENKEKFVKLIESLKECSEIPPDHTVIVRTNNSIMYKDSDENFLIKESKLLRDTYRILNIASGTFDIAKGPSDCKAPIKQAERSLNEADNAVHFSALFKELYPQHFITIEHLNTCRYHPDNDFSVFFKIEKVKGKTLLELLDSQELTDDILFKLILQLLYVLIHLNAMGWYHNDIKLNNIMAYQTNLPNIEYSQMKNIKLQIEQPLYFFKLIDYSDTIFINPSDEIKLFDIVQFINLILVRFNENESESDKYPKSYDLVKRIGEVLANDGTPNVEANTHRFLTAQGISDNSKKISLSEIMGLFQTIQGQRYKNINIETNVKRSRSVNYKLKYLQLKKLTFQSS